MLILLSHCYAWLSEFNTCVIVSPILLSTMVIVSWLVHWVSLFIWFANLGFLVTYPLWTHHMMYLHVAFWAMAPHLTFAPFVPKNLVHLFYDLYCNKAFAITFYEFSTYTLGKEHVCHGLEIFPMLFLLQHQLGSIMSIELKRHHCSQSIVSTPLKVGQ